MSVPSVVLDHDAERSAVSSSAAKIGCSFATLQEWVQKTAVDSKRAGLAKHLAEKMKALERENNETRQADELQRKALASFTMAQLDYPFKR